MQYFGGKAKFRGNIISLINNEISFIAKETGHTPKYLEPFVGGASILGGIKAKVRIGSDANPAMIFMYKSLIDGWTPPIEVSENEHAKAKKMHYSNPLKAFIGISCSFGATWFYSYRDNGHAKRASRLLVHSAKDIKNTVWVSADYRAFNPEGCVIYCDPPYAGTQGIGMYKAVGKFDSKEFWQVMKEWSKRNKVFVSEYTAPKEWSCVMSMLTKGSSGRHQGVSSPTRVEKVFMLKPRHSKVFILKPSNHVRTLWEPLI